LDTEASKWAKISYRSKTENTAPKNRTMPKKTGIKNEGWKKIDLHCKQVLLF